MKAEKAIEVLQDYLDKIDFDRVHDADVLNAFYEALDALNKHIPEPPEVKPDLVCDDGIVAYKRVCPDCGYELKEEDICPNCGKWIRWDE